MRNPKISDLSEPSKISILGKQIKHSIQNTANKINKFKETHGN